MKTYECIAHSGNTGKQIVLFVRAYSASSARADALVQAKTTVWQQRRRHYCSYGFGQFVFDQCPSNGVLDRRDSRVAAEIEHYYAQTKEIIVANRSKLDKLTARLIEEKTLLGDQVQEIIKCA